MFNHNTSTPVRLTLRALACLIGYPGAELRALLPGLIDALRLEQSVAPARLRELRAELAAMDFSSDTAIEEALKALAARHGLGFGDYQSVARLAVSGTNVGPSITGLFRVLGRERVLARMRKLAGA